MIHPCFGKRFTVYQLNVQAATVEKEKHQPFRNIFFLRAPFRLRVRNHINQFLKYYFPKSYIIKGSD